MLLIGEQPNLHEVMLSMEISGDIEPDEEVQEVEEIGRGRKTRRQSVSRGITKSKHPLLQVLTSSGLYK